MTAGSSTASPRTCWPLRATATWSGSRGTTRITRLTERSGWAPPPSSRTGSATSPSREADPLHDGRPGSVRHGLPRRSGLAVAETGEHLLLEALLLGAVTNLASDGVHERRPVEWRPGAGRPRDVLAAEHGGDGAHEFRELRFDGRLRPAQRGVDSRGSCRRGERRSRTRSAWGRRGGLARRQRRPLTSEQREESGRWGKIVGPHAIDDGLGEAEAATRDLAQMVGGLEPTARAEDHGDDRALAQPDAHRLVVGGGDEHGTRAPGRAE